MCTILGLLAKGDINCAGGEMPTAGDLFEPTNMTVSTVTNDPMRVRKPGDLAPGTVQTAAEKKLAEEEAERQRLEKEAEQQRQKEKQEEEERRRRRENSPINKMWKQIKKFGKTLTAAEEE